MGEQEFDPERPYTCECVTCGRRVEADSRPERCPGRGYPMRDLSVPRD